MIEVRIPVLVRGEPELEDDVSEVDAPSIICQNTKRLIARIFMKSHGKYFTRLVFEWNYFRKLTYVMDKKNSIDIETDDDFEYVKFLMH